MSRKVKGIKILDIDIETAPSTAYIWQLKTGFIPAKQVASPGHTLCFAAKWRDAPAKSTVFKSIWDDGMEGMVSSAYDLMEEADAVCHYNGKKFDVPTLHTEFIKYLGKRPTPHIDIDLFSVVRKNFKFLSYSLDFVCKELGIGSKLQHKGMDLWTECMSGNAKSQAVMEKYNRQDIRLLPRLYDRLLPWIDKHPNFGLFLDDDRPVCSNCGSHKVIKAGMQVNKTRSYQRYRCTGCGTPLRGTRTVTPTEKGKNMLVSV